MPLKILGFAKDTRTDTDVVYAQVTLSEYLPLIGDNYGDFDIQRKQERYRPYERLKQDIQAGALLPPITLAIKPEAVAEARSALSTNDESRLTSLLSKPGQVNILDGLQRTFILNDLAREGRLPDGGSILLEYWLEGDVKHLIYRIIILNAGRKPMSMRHQVELLFQSLQTQIEEKIPGLEMYRERDQTRRRGPRKFALDRIAVAYHCFLLKSHDIERDSIIAQQLKESEVLGASEDELAREFDMFIHYLKRYSDLDEDVCRVYSSEDEAKGMPTGALWFGSETTLNAFFAAVSEFGSTTDRKSRIEAAINAMQSLLKSSTPGEDPLQLQTFGILRKDFDSRRVNIGSATRKLVFNTFKEYFRECGEKSWRECWLSAE
jgi:hypothetical protein